MTDTKRKKQGRVKDAMDALSALDGEGFVALIALGVALLLGWLVVEFVVPAVVLGCYLLLLAALRRAARDRHDCQGRLGRSALWGLFWATLYTLPLWLLALIMYAV